MHLNDKWMPGHNTSPMILNRMNCRATFHLTRHWNDKDPWSVRVDRFQVLGHVGEEGKGQADDQGWGVGNKSRSRAVGVGGGFLMGGVGSCQENGGELSMGCVHNINWGLWERLVILALLLASHRA